MNNSPVTNDHTYSISELHGLKQISQSFSNFGDDYIFAHLNSAQHLKALCDSPLRFGGFTCILCLDGEIEVEVNMTSYTLRPGSLINIVHDNTFIIRSFSGNHLEAYLFVVSTNFMHDVNFDLNVLHSLGYDRDRSPMITVNHSDIGLLQRYFELIHINTSENADAIYVRSITRNLFAALIYQIIQCARNHTDSATREKPLSRRDLYFKEFMRLIHRYHRTERSVKFYASQLFISPKYLSLIIKETTGRTASQWIDDFVVLEAKNMLRFSGMSVQQISIALNFSSQSAFGKYFKHATGMSPTEYQHS